MRVTRHTIAGEAVEVRYAESDEDARAFLAWLGEGRPVVALDTETTGLGIYTPGFACRLVQFGDRDTAWVLRADRFAATIREALDRQPRFVVHNAAFDAKVLDHVGLADMDALLSKTFDTRVLAHLNDPRGPAEGGMGLGLKPLSAHLVDADAPDTAGGLTEVFRKEYKATKETGWAVIDIDHPTYVLYAGLDVILTARLFAVLGPLVKERGLSRLATFEHAVQASTCRMERRGVLLDVPYTERLAERLTEEAADWQRKAAVYGVENVNSPAQVAEALEGMGETLTERTPGGALKVDKEILLRLADLDRDLKPLGSRAPNPVAEAVFHSKRAAKWSVSYAEAMLHGRDSANRVHPSIRSLQARTGRMSVAGPPLQQLPSGDWTIRRCLVADPGMVIGGVDYQAVELRVLAALADVKKMKTAIAAGEDLHGYTASLIYGADYTPAHRKLAKAVGLGKVYGGGAVTLARQSGAPLADVKVAVAAYDRVYPEVRRYGKRLQDRALSNGGAVETPAGRLLPLDRDRTYAATNYAVQSTAADLLKQALLDLEDAGLGGYLLLPVHDEVVYQAPAAEAEEVARAIAETMATEDFFGVPIGADAAVYGPSWGHGYGYTDAPGAAA